MPQAAEAVQSLTFIRNTTVPTPTRPFTFHEKASLCQDLHEAAGAGVAR